MGKTASDAGPVLVSGAAGFIGANLVRALLPAGMEVQGLIRPGSTDTWRLRDLVGEIEILEADLRDAEGTERALATVRPRFVINAIRTAHSGDLTEQVAGHVTTAANLLAATRAVGCERLVQLGTSLEYGPAPSPIDERTPLRPNTPFGAAKAAATTLILSAPDSGGPATTVLRPFNVYGPWDHPERLIQTAIAAAIEGRPLPMTEVGLRRDWVFVGDVARACVLALGGAADHEVLNLGTGVDTANEEVVALVGEAVGRPLRTVAGAIRPRPWDATRRYSATSKAREILGWTASVALGEGIRRTVEWFQSTVVPEDAAR